MKERISQVSNLQKDILPEQDIPGNLPPIQEEADKMRAEYEFDQNSIRNPYIKQGDFSPKTQVRNNKKSNKD